MTRARLHLDTDSSVKALYEALRARGHDVTRTPNEWMPSDATDEIQLLGATARGRAILTFNIRDFLILVKMYPNHGGIILATQRSMMLSDLIQALDNLLTRTESPLWTGQVRWLKDWAIRREK